ncbi:MAG: HTH domain-containing protein [Methylophilaceae bacterium]|nr:HTH domain-containing protein [Methylophilaceae bacterium]
MQIKIESTEDFFARGKSVATLADQGNLEAACSIVSFENAEDLARVITAAKIRLFREIRAHPGSISDISKRLNRDRSSVKRDIDVLHAIGLVDMNIKINAGHGIKKEVVVRDPQVLMAL